MSDEASPSKKLRRNTFAFMSMSRRGTVVGTGDEGEGGSSFKRRTQSVLPPGATIDEGSFDDSPIGARSRAKSVFGADDAPDRAEAKKRLEACRAALNDSLDFALGDLLKQPAVARLPEQQRADVEAAVRVAFETVGRSARSSTDDLAEAAEEKARAKVREQPLDAPCALAHTVTFTPAPCTLPCVAGARAAAGLCCLQPAPRTLHML